MTRVMVTGGAGFIGSNLTDLLIEKGYHVKVVDNMSTGKMENLSRHLDSSYLTLIEKDINEIDIDDMENVHGVFHLAARVNVVDSIKKPMEDARVNYQGTINVLEKCRRSKIKKILFTSSAAVYGDVPIIPTPEEAPKVPLSPYGNHKLASGNLLRMYNMIHGMNNVIFRLFNVYGPRQDPSNPYSGVISKFMEWASKGHELIIYGDGNQTRDFVYVGDVAQSFLRAYERNINGTFNIGTSKETSVNELARRIISITDSGSQIFHRRKREGEIYRSLCKNIKLKDALGWTPSTTIETGLEKYWSTIK